MLKYCIFNRVSMNIDIKSLLEIHKDMPRQGSGRNKYTQKAFEMIPKINQPTILDIGCGPGLQTIKLAKMTDGTIYAIDIFEQYLDQLRESIKKEKLDDRIKPLNQSMNNIEFPENYFDIIWAEGSIFVIGFEKGLKEWKKYIKPNRYLAIHDMTWLKDNPPDEIKKYFQRVYPGLLTIEKSLNIIKNSDYKPLGYFPLPEDAWWDLYYNPLEKRLKKLEIKYKNNQKALDLIKAEYEEIDLFRKYNQWYGSVFYIMQKM